MLFGIFSFILEIIFGFITALLLVRTAMRWMRISFVNQLGQFVLAATNWIVLPCQKILPSVGRLDLASLLPAWLLQILLLLIVLIVGGASFSHPLQLILGLLLIGLLDLFKAALWLLMLIVFVGAILSWVNPYSPMAPMIRVFSEPFIAPLRRIIPPLANIDLSPLVLLILLQIILNFILPAARNVLLPLLLA